MALFAFISGFFYKYYIKTKKDLFSVLKKKIIPLYTFYLKYEILFLIFRNFFFKIGFYSSYVNYGNKIIYPIESFYQFIYNIIKIVILMGREPFCGAFWYIVTLIFILIIYTFVNYLSEKFKNKEQIKLIIILAIFLVGCIMNIFDFNIPRLSPAFTLILPFYVGNLIGNKKIKVFFTNTNFFIISILSFLYINNTGIVAMNQNKFSSVIFLLLCMIYGIYIVIFISKKIEKKFFIISNLLQYIGKNTLSIMAWHYLGFKIISLIQLILNKISVNDLAVLTGVNNQYEKVYILYLLSGIFIPLVINIGVEKIKKLIE